MMKMKLSGLTLAAAALAGCVEDSGDTGFSNNITPPAGMESMCINQASRMTGTPAGAIEVNSRIETGGGPLITLNAAGSSYSCRQESDGSVTVFSEYAN